jgi:hypothetical protein
MYFATLMFATSQLSPNIVKTCSERVSVVDAIILLEGRTDLGAGQTLDQIIGWPFVFKGLILGTSSYWGQVWEL